MKFGQSLPLTLGAELELQLLNRNTFELSSSSMEILKRARGREEIKAEIYQSMIEITTGICADAKEISLDLRRTLSLLAKICEDMDLILVSAGTNPVADYQDGTLFPESRYHRLLEKHQWLAKRLLIFGFHVHVGMRSGDHAIQMMHALMSYLPLLLSLSTSSPFLIQEDTKLSSARTTFFEALPTGGHPYLIRNWDDYSSLYRVLCRSGAISSPKDLWWDIRPSPELGTIEIRICDSPATIKEASAIVALIHMLCQHLDQQLLDGKTLPPPPEWMFRENKWRACRSGVNAEFVVSPDGHTSPVRDFLAETLERLSYLIEKNNYESEMEVLRRIIKWGGSTERQRHIFNRYNGNFKSVLSSLAKELMADQPDWLTIKITQEKSKNGGEECA